MTMASFKFSKEDIQLMNEQSRIELEEAMEKAARHIALTTVLRYDEAKKMLQDLAQHAHDIIVYGGTRSRTERLIGISNGILGDPELAKRFEALFVKPTQIGDIESPIFAVRDNRAGRRQGHKLPNSKPFWVQKWEKNASKRR